MLALLQKVSSASVEVNNVVVGSIGVGICVLLGIRENDSEVDIEFVTNRIANAHIFQKDEKRFAIGALSVLAQVIIIPQYTLYGDITHKNSPSFTNAMKPEQAEMLFLKFCDRMEVLGLKVAKGVFREYMKVNIVNEGPVTFTICSDHLHK